MLCCVLAATSFAGPPAADNGDSGGDGPPLTDNPADNLFSIQGFLKDKKRAGPPLQVPGQDQPQQPGQQQTQPPAPPPAPSPAPQGEEVAPPTGGGGENVPGTPAPVPAPNARRAAPPPVVAQQPYIPPALVESMDALGEDLRGTADPQEQQRRIAAALPQVVPLLTSPEMERMDRRERNTVLNAIAYVLNQVGKNEEAKTLSDDVLARSADNRDALNNRAISNYGLKDYSGALSDANAALSGREDERAYTTRALTNWQTGRYMDAMDDAKRALALNPNNQVAHQIAKTAANRITTAEHLGLDRSQREAAEKLKREFEAMESERSAIEASAPGPATASARPAGGAEEAVKQGDYTGALKEAEAAASAAPDDAAALQLKASALSMTGQYEAAVRESSAALQKDPRNLASLNTRASALLNLKRFREALLDAGKALEVDPNNGYAHHNRALAKEQLGDLEGMLDDCRRAAALSPRFESECRDLAGKYGLQLDAPPAPGGGASPTASAPRANRRFLVVLVSSLTGGFLVAFGLMHVLWGSGPATLARRLKSRPEEPGLESGYRILRTLGNGGMGVVYEAYDKALNRKVAIKKMRDELRLDDHERARFLQEARIVAALHHPNIVDIHTIIEDGGELYIVFEYVDGMTLDQVVARKKRLTLAEAQHVVRGICAALAYAHEHGVVHRDLKPSNVMATQEGRVKVMDFGIARQAKDTLAKQSATNTVAGTPLYMAPEQEQGIVCKESDLYALGACVYEMLTGERPFKSPATTASKLAKAYTKPSRVASNLPPELDAFIDAALEPDPEKRIRTAEEFRARFEAIGVRPSPLHH